jgi:hypothetical protein
MLLIKGKKSLKQHQDNKNNYISIFINCKLWLSKFEAIWWVFWIKDKIKEIIRIIITNQTSQMCRADTAIIQWMNKSKCRFNYVHSNMAKSEIWNWCRQRVCACTSMYIMLKSQTNYNLMILFQTLRQNSTNKYKCVIKFKILWLRCNW